MIGWFSVYITFWLIIFFISTLLGIGISTDRWHSWLHRHIGFPWKGLFNWPTECNFLTLMLYIMERIMVLGYISFHWRVSIDGIQSCQIVCYNFQNVYFSDVNHCPSAYTQHSIFTALYFDYVVEDHRVSCRNSVKQKICPCMVSASLGQFWNFPRSPRSYVHSDVFTV